MAEGSISDYKIWLKAEERKCANFGMEKLAEIEQAVNDNRHWLESYINQILDKNSVVQKYIL